MTSTEAASLPSLDSESLLEKDEFEFPWEDGQEELDDSEELVPSEDQKMPSLHSGQTIRGCEWATFSNNPKESLKSSLRFKGKSHLEQIAYGLRMLCLFGSDDCSFQILKLQNIRVSARQRRTASLSYV
eukprot:Gregarina_sp_Poly_1__5495@NODE_28_length_19636_cov_263_287087_g25_i0_p11_GENE_NODE_28_length_19636_cov_263_287087_g25_i0NODE_28_length_19636_cov_263_287087_g25_i0_p11_ORF_typecomplete_len129_score28_44_NODE_28_length_19636_cov_263_287087_g25_i01791618302